jgi:hypothetical protein
MHQANHNYAPPKAPVADPAPSVTPPMPSQVRVAVYLLYAQIALVMVSTFAVLQKTLPFYGQLSGVGTVAIWALVPYFISKASRLARVILVVLVLLAVAGTAVTLSLHLHVSTIPRSISWIAFALRVIATGLLFTKPANAWFKRKISRYS